MSDNHYEIDLLQPAVPSAICAYTPATLNRNHSSHRFRYLNACIDSSRDCCVSSSVFPSLIAPAIRIVKFNFVAFMRPADIVKTRMPSSDTPCSSQAAAQQLISHFFISISLSFSFSGLPMVSRNSCNRERPSHFLDSIHAFTGFHSTASTFK